jgi:Putative Flp pilus-assembly TadE/G-like
MKRNTNRSGQAVLLMTLSLTVMLGMMSLVADVGWGYFRREAAQSAADAAAAGAVKAVEVALAGGTPSCGSGNVWCGSTPGTITNCPATAPTSTTSSFNVACILANANGGFTTTGGITVSVQANTTTPPPTVSGATVSYWVTVRISERTASLFGTPLVATGNSWQKTHAYALGTDININGYIEQVSTAGTSGSTEPTFNVTTGQTTTDGTVTWTSEGSSNGLTSNVLATSGITTSGSTTSPPCIIVLGGTGTTFTIGNGATVTTSSCGVYVNSSATTGNDAAWITATLISPSLSVVGTDLVNNGGCIKTSSSAACGTLTPHTGVAAIADPFSTLAAPTIPSSCSSGNFTAWQPTAYTPTAGCYNGFSVGNGMSAVLGAGIYVINGGSFSVQGGGTLTATSGVMIYLTNGAYVNIGNGVTVNMAPQSTGAYEGILFFQDRTMTSPPASTFEGGSNTTMTGSLYFPYALVNVNNGSAANTEALVVNSVNFQGGATFNQATTQAQTGLVTSSSSVSVLQ